MIINGGSRCNGAFFAGHLMRADHNERVEVVEINGLGSQNVRDAFHEMEAVASGTQCKNYFYHTNLNIRADEHLTREQWVTAANRIEQELGLTGQPRIIVEHEKEGRTHWHVVWSRIDADSMTAISDSLTYRKHEQAARAIEEEFGLQPVESVLVKDREQERPERNPKDWESFRGQATGIDPKAMKAEITALWQEADTGQAFKAALEEAGYILAKGDRRDFCIIDSGGDEHSLARRISGVKAAEIRARMSDIDRDALPSVAEGRELAIAAGVAGIDAADTGRQVEEEQGRVAEAFRDGLVELADLDVRQLGDELADTPNPVREDRQEIMPGEVSGKWTEIVREASAPERISPWGNAWRSFADRVSRFAETAYEIWHDESSGIGPGKWERLVTAGREMLNPDGGSFVEQLAQRGLDLWSNERGSVPDVETTLKPWEAYRRTLTHKLENDGHTAPEDGQEAEPQPLRETPQDIGEAYRRALRDHPHDDYSHDYDDDRRTPDAPEPDSPDRDEPDMDIG